MDLSDVTAVVVAHDPSPELGALLGQLAGLPGLQELVVVDSGSAPGVLEAALGDRTPARVVRFASNVGPCVTRNRGLEEAQTPLVLLLDDDMELDSSAPLLLKRELERSPGRVMAGPRILKTGEPGLVQYEGGICHYAGLPHMRNLEQAASAGPPTEVDVLSAGCLLVRREPLLAAGGFNESFFYLMEDVELSLRLRLLGHELVVVPEARAWNRGGSAGISLDGTGYPSRRVYFHSRNRWLLLLSLYRPWTLLVLAPALLFFDLVWLVFACAAGHPRAWLSGKLSAVRAIPGVRARRRGLARRRLADAELLKAPGLTWTRAALAQPAARRLSAIVDGIMRLYFLAMRWAIS